MIEWLLELARNGSPLLLDWAAFLARLVIGATFAISGYCKLFDPDQAQTMRETLEEADIPKPRPMAKLVAANELLWGTALALGLLHLVAAGALLIITAVAFVTHDYEERDGRNFAYWLSVLFFKPQVLILLILLLLIASGPGVLALHGLYL